MVAFSGEYNETSGTGNLIIVKRVDRHGAFSILKGQWAFFKVIGGEFACIWDGCLTFLIASAS